MSHNNTLLPSPTSRPTELEPAKYLPFEKERWEVLHWAKLSYRYHKKREWFFNFCDVSTQVICTLAGFAIFADFFNKVWIAGAVVAALSILALVVRYSDCKQLHIELARRTLTLIADIEGIPLSEVNQSNIAAWVRVRGHISSDEPPSIKTLVALCEWEQGVEDGYPGHADKLNFYQKIHRHFF